MKQFVRRVWGRFNRATGGGIAELQGQVATLQSQFWEILDRFDERGNVSKATQTLLAFAYRRRLAEGADPPSFAEVEFRNYSETGEDGILHFLFTLLGTTNQRLIDLCVGHGRVSNTANLLVNYGWSGLLVDGDLPNIRAAEAFFQKHIVTRIHPPRIVHTWVTSSNIEALIRENAFDGDIDLLSLDMDGVDYWVWKALAACVRPRVVMLEFNWVLGPERSVTIPDRADFRCESPRGTPTMDHLYYGASLAAFVKLGRALGYRLVGNTLAGQNAVFLRNGVGEDLFPEVPASKCYEPPSLLRNWTPRYLKDLKPHWEWIEV